MEDFLVNFAVGAIMVIVAAPFLWRNWFQQDQDEEAEKEREKLKAEVETRRQREAEWEAETARKLNDEQ
jgi:hypothetical protein